MRLPYFKALDYFTKAVTYNPRDESAFLNRAITKVRYFGFTKFV